MGGEKKKTTPFSFAPKSFTHRPNPATQCTAMQHLGSLRNLVFTKFSQSSTIWVGGGAPSSKGQSCIGGERTHPSKYEVMSISQCIPFLKTPRNTAEVWMCSMRSTSCNLKSDREGYKDQLQAKKRENGFLVNHSGPQSSANLLPARVTKKRMQERWFGPKTGSRQSRDLKIIRLGSWDQ